MAPSPDSQPQPSRKGPPPGSTKDAKRLSCVSCRTRKVRCDRVMPCAPCQRSGMTCVFPKPAPPRARIGAKAKSAEIQGRLSRLESLLGSLGGEEAVADKARAIKELKRERNVAGADKGNSPKDSNPEANVNRTASANEGAETCSRPNPKLEDSDPVLKEGGGRFVGGEFWANLSSEVDGLKELLNDKDGDEEEEEGEDSMSSPSTISATADTGMGASPDVHFTFEGAESGPAIDLTEWYPYPPLVTWLFETYFTRFDPTFKILHKPSSATDASRLKRYDIGSVLWKAFPKSNSAWTIFNAISFDAERSNIRSGQEALVFAIFYAAVTCATPEECTKQFHEDRTTLVKRYEKAAQAALTNADYINSNELVSLQAFIIYLACYRSHHETRTMWTLLALATRIAYALDLHCDGSLLGLSTFDTELRRRTWWQLAVLDGQASEDRGTIPMLMGHTFDTQMPTNVNDEDLDPKLGLKREGHLGCTEITFSLITHEACRALQILASSYPKRSSSISTTPSTSSSVPTLSHEAREHHVAELSQRFHSRFIVHCDPQVPIDWFCSMVAQIIILKFSLLGHYPAFSQHSRYNPSELRAKNRPSRDSLLSMAISLLELQHRIEHASLPWAWIARNFVQWHPLAVTLATLCSMAPGSSPLIGRAWAIIDTVFDEWSARVADNRKGNLWLPIRKLLDKARKVHGRTGPGPGASQSPKVGDGKERTDTNVDMATGVEAVSKLALHDEVTRDKPRVSQQQQQQPQPPQQMFPGLRGMLLADLPEAPGVGSFVVPQSQAWTPATPQLQSQIQPHSQPLQPQTQSPAYTQSHSPWHPTGQGQGMDTDAQPSMYDQSLAMALDDTSFLYEPPSGGAATQGAGMQGADTNAADRHGADIQGLAPGGPSFADGGMGFMQGASGGTGIAKMEPDALGFDDGEMLDVGDWGEWERFLEGTQGLPTL